MIWWLQILGFWPVEPVSEEKEAKAEADLLHFFSPQQVHINELNALEAKFAVLLSHISLMIAVTSVMFSFGSDLKWLLGLEVIAYLLLALVCLRGQNQLPISVKSMERLGLNSNELKRQYANGVVWSEVFLKRRAFTSVQKLLRILTMILILTIFLEIISAVNFEKIAEGVATLVSETETPQ